MRAKAYRAECCHEARACTPAAPTPRKTSHAASNTMRTSIRKPNPHRDPKESYKRRTLIPLACQSDLERARVVAHQTHCAEYAPKLNDWSKHPIFPPNGSHCAFMLRSVSEESGCTLEVLAADRQPDVRRFLNVAHPVAVHVRCADVEPVAVKNEPDRDLVGLPRSCVRDESVS